MNKRILELAEQASVEYIASEQWVFTNEELMRFAESIVQECCDVVTPYTIKDGVMFDVSTNLHPIYVIKKHFGVTV